jgi:hypothetical protein
LVNDIQSLNAFNATAADEGADAGNDDEGADAGNDDEE